MRTVFEYGAVELELPEPDLGEISTTTPITIYKRMEDYTITTYNIPNASRTEQMSFNLDDTKAQALLSFIDAYKGKVINYYPYIDPWVDVTYEYHYIQGYILGNVNTVEYSLPNFSTITLKFRVI